MLFLLLTAVTANATEVDSITVRESVEDATESLNLEVNRRIETAIRSANRWGECSEKRLYKALGKQLRAGATGFFMLSPLENHANWSDEVPKGNTPRSESIYKSVQIHESFPITLYPLGKVIRVNDHIIAGDKFSHFFNVGWTYYKIHYKDGEPIEVALEYGDTTERMIWGLLTTGVYSWADLVANFQGMRFWASVLGEHDVLGSRFAPLVTCHNGSWVQNRNFRWENWVEAGWDEGINCNTYAPRFAEKIEEVNRERLELGLEVCPVRPESCSAIRRALGPFSEAMVNPICTE